MTVPRMNEMIFWKISVYVIEKFDKKKKKRAWMPKSHFKKIDFKVFIMVLLSEK